MPVYRTETTDPVEAARAGIERARADRLDAVIVDTAGRLQVDTELMDELGRVRDAVEPTNALLVLDAMTGQQAADVAVAFEQRIDFDGVILTKLDGDARGGAALSVKSVTGRPIMFASTGEKLDMLEVFHPDRMASRILGMGDVLTLIERAEQAASEEETASMEARMRKGQFTFDDFLQAQKMLRRMGPLQGVLKMMPGIGSQLAGLDVDEGRLKRVEAIVLSMTPRERAIPHLIDGRRRQRIAMGSGSTVQEVSQLLEARKAMEKMMGQMSRGKMPALPGPRRPRRDAGGGGPAAAPRRLPCRAARRRRRRRASASPVVGKLSAWQSSSGSHAWAQRRTRSTASSPPTRTRRVTAGSSRSSAATTRRPIPRRSSSTRRRSRAGSARALSPPRRSPG